MKEEIQSIIKTNSYFDIEYLSDEGVVESYTREHGSVGDGEASEKDVREAHKLVKLIKEKFPKVATEVEEVDEWVHLTIHYNEEL